MLTAKSSRRPLRTLTSLGALLALSAGLAACGGGASSAGTAGASDVAKAPYAAAGDAGSSAVEAAPATRGAYAGQAQGSGPVSIQTRAIVRTAAVTLEVKDLPAAIRGVHTVAAGLGGYVASEKSGLSPDSNKMPEIPTPSASGDPTAGVVSAPGSESVIELRIPVDRLDQAIINVEKLGVVVTRISSAQDVTGDVADLQSRLANQRTSVERIRTLLNQATSIKDIVVVEGELSQREAELEALEARLATLTDQADLATYTVQLTVPNPFIEAKPANGFLKGLRAGWHALGVSTIVLVTVLGAMLPIVGAAIIVLIPLIWLARRRRHAGRAGVQWPASKTAQGAPSWPSGPSYPTGNPPAQTGAINPTAAPTPGSSPDTGGTPDPKGPAHG